jgi:iron complex outermembrane recepter protein
VNRPREIGFMLVALLLCAPAKAQEEGEAVERAIIELEAIVVTGDPLGGTEEHISQPVSVLGRQELLTRRDRRNIGEAVAHELGVTSSDFGPAVGRPIIRGLGEGRVRVLEDGIGTLDVSTISPDHAVATEPLFADQIEIFRGPAALLYGSGATGGVVNIVNRRILDYVPEAIEGDLYGHYNSVADDFTGAFRLNAGSGNVGLHLDGLKRSTRDYGIPGFADVDSEPGARKGILENSDIQTENFSGGMSFVGERGFVGFAIGSFSNKYGVPGHDHGHDDHGHNDHGHSHDHGHGHDDHGHNDNGLNGHGHNDDGVRIEQSQTRVDIKGALYDPLPGFHTAKTRWGYNDHTLREFEGGNGLETFLNNKEWEGRVEFLHEPLGAWEGVVGLQYRNRDLSTAGLEAFVPSSESDSVSVFMLEKRDWRDWHFELGGRFEHQEAERAQDRLSTSHNLFSVSGGALWEFADDYFLGANISHAQRAPAVEELFSDGPHFATNTFEVGDPALKKETSNNFDLSLRKRRSRLNWTLNFFANFINDFIFLQEVDRAGDGLPDRVNAAGEWIADPGGLLLVNHFQSDAEFLGVEFETVVGLLDHAWGKLDLRLWTDYVRGKLTDGRNLPRITPLRFGSDLDYSRGPWYAGINLMRIQRQTDTAPLETATDGYTILNGHLGYNLTWGPVRYTLFLRGINLLNEEARRHTSFLKDRAPLPGRSAMIGVNANF